MPIEKISFDAGELANLEPGKIAISAPSLKDVLQISVIEQDGKVPLDITVGQGTVAVKRTDNQPLQVDLVGNLSGDHTTLHHPVFRRPQPDVRFVRRDDEQWELENDTDVIDGGFRIGVFADVIGIYGLQKQQREKMRRVLINRFYRGLLELTLDKSSNLC